MRPVSRAAHRSGRSGPDGSQAGGVNRLCHIGRRVLYSVFRYADDCTVTEVTDALAKSLASEAIWPTIRTVPTRFTFDPEKALEAIVYVAARARQDLYGTLKLIYVADKRHLERFGRFMFGETYSAMEWGPVPSNSYDIVKFVRGDRPHSRNEHAKAAFRMRGNNFELLREPDLGVLSESDIACLDEAIAEHGRGRFEDFKRLTHDQAWTAAWATARGGSVSIPVESIASQLERAQALIQHLSDPHPGEN
jgi:hypothetical protein